MNKSDKTKNNKNIYKNTNYINKNIYKMVSSSNALIKHETTPTTTTLNSISVATLPTAMPTTSNFVEQQSNKCQQIMHKNNNIIHPQQQNIQQQQQQLSGNAKMGSRRIFTPQFKLQVLESYRNDNDCKGNQRATARKYNIHRRQIQKWLQCEPNLRSSVANINQSQVKHQFHNITHQQQQHHHHQQQQPQQQLHNPHHHHHQQQQQQQQQQQHTTKQMNSTLTVPSLVVNTQQQQQQPITVSANHNNNTINNNSSNNHNNNNNSNDVLTAANFAAAVAVAASMANNAANERPTISPLRGSTVTIEETPHFHHLTTPHHHHHHHHHQHAYAAAAAAAYTYQHPQLYAHHHNLLAVAHHHLPPQPIPPPAQLPLHNHAHQIYTTPVTQQPHEFSGAFKPTITSTTAACLWQQVEATDDRTNHHHHHHHKETSLEVDVVDADIEVEILQDKIKNQATTNSTQLTSSTTSTSIPIDLSITKRHNCEEYKNKCTNAALVVDLTFRKRKSTITTTNTITATNTTTSDTPAEKIPKFNGNINNDVSSTSAAAKPVKLFKPYLLDDEDNVDDGELNQQQTLTKQLPLAPIPIPLTPQSQQQQTDVVGGTFQNDKYTFPYFPATGASLFSPSSVSASAPALSPSSFRCPKGSPVSGYESSSSTYSDSSFRGNDSSNILLNNNNSSTSAAIRTSFSLELRAVYSPPHAHQHVQRWLDQDTQSCLTPATTPTPTSTPTPPNHNLNHNPPAAHTSIALYA